MPSKNLSIMNRAMLFALCALYSNASLNRSSIAKNDPYPLYSAEYPYVFLTNDYRNFQKNFEEENYYQERFSLHVSPFRQTASTGRDINKNVAELGNLTGPWNIIALFYPAASNGSTAMQNQLVNVLGLSTFLTTSCNNADTSNSAITFGDLLTDPSRTDIKREFGFFSVPINYRKYGVRFEVDFHLAYDFGLQLQTGIVDLVQTASFIDLTCQSIGRQCPLANETTTNSCDIDKIGCDCKRLLMQKVMNQRDLIAKTIGVSLKNFDIKTFEDTSVGIYWRHVFPINKNRKSWPYFLLMPFFSINYIAPSTQHIDPQCIFGISAGNNNHQGVNFETGLNFDFVETVEVGIQGSITNFQGRCYSNVPVPVHELQTGIFPYRADLFRKPGLNWTLSASLDAYHFLDRLSTYIQYVVIGHGKDQFTNVRVKPIANEIPPEALVCKMSNESNWHSHMMNVGFTYDLSPYIAVGFLWQTPLSQRNAYRSTTIMASLIVTW